MCASADLGNGVRSRRGVFRGHRSGSTQWRIEISHVASHLNSHVYVTRNGASSRPVRSRWHAPDPTLRERAHVVLGWNGLDHGDRERERVLFRRLLAMKREVLVMVNVLGLGIFDPYNPARARQKRARRGSTAKLSTPGPLRDPCRLRLLLLLPVGVIEIPCSNESLHGNAPERIQPGSIPLARQLSRARGSSIRVRRLDLANRRQPGPCIPPLLSARR